MAKTDMTINIEKALRYYRPSETCGIRINKFRNTHTAFEVPAVCGTTASGLVDCVRVQEYFGDNQRIRVCQARRWGWNKQVRLGLADACPLGILGKDGAPERCEERACRYNVIAERGAPKILITAYEIKVTRADFRSEHGHNFVGNCNYYVIPKELYEAVEPDVPPDIGIILYLHAGSYVGLRRKRECAYKELTDEDQKWLILSVMKRLEDTTWKERYNSQEAPGYW